MYHEPDDVGGTVKFTIHEGTYEFLKEKMRIQGYTVRGVCSNGLIYMKDQDDNWYQLDTQGAEEWDTLPEDMPREWLGAAFIVGLTMLQGGIDPVQVTSEQTRSELQRLTTKTYH